MVYWQRAKALVRWMLRWPWTIPILIVAAAFSAYSCFYFVATVGAMDDGSDAAFFSACAWGWLIATLLCIAAIIFVAWHLLKTP